MVYEIKQELINEGKNPNDFKIKSTGSGYEVVPRPLYESKQVAKKEDKPIKDDVNDVALTTAYVLEDSMTTAETVAFLLLEISTLKAEIEVLKGGKK